MVKIHNTKCTFLTILKRSSVPFSIFSVVRQISRTLSSCISETMYPLNNSSFPSSPALSHHHSTFCFYECDHCRYIIGGILQYCLFVPIPHFIQSLNMTQLTTLVPLSSVSRPYILICLVLFHWPFLIAGCQSFLISQISMAYPYFGGMICKLHKRKFFTKVNLQNIWERQQKLSFAAQRHQVSN